MDRLVAREARLTVSTFALLDRGNKPLVFQVYDFWIFAASCCAMNDMKPWLADPGVLFLHFFDSASASPRSCFQVL
jgi:hypothetical protein